MHIRLPGSAHSSPNYKRLIRVNQPVILATSPICPPETSLLSIENVNTSLSLDQWPDDGQRLRRVRCFGQTPNGWQQSAYLLDRVRAEKCMFATGASSKQAMLTNWGSSPHPSVDDHKISPLFTEMPRCSVAQWNTWRGNVHYQRWMAGNDGEWAGMTGNDGTRGGPRP